MQWIDGIARKNNKFVAVKTDNTGQITTRPLSNLSELPKPLGKYQKSKLDTNFQDWEIASATEYLRGVGLPIQASGSHRVFRFSRQQVTYLIPAHVLFKATFRPLGVLTSYLFRPQGLEQTCVPTLEDARVNFVLQGLSQRTQSCTSLQHPLSWLWCFPSARRMWESVYAYACNGALACDLPLGDARIVVTGISKEDFFYVTEMTILQIKTGETPFEFALTHPKTIVFHEGISFRRRQPDDFVAKADRTIVPINGQWALTDSEWDAIYPLFSEQEKRGNPNRKHELRTLIDGIIGKLGTGIPWKKYKYETGTWSNASKLYGECRKDGRWAKIQLILNRSRLVLN